jgi:hypothetical protein
MDLDLGLGLVLLHGEEGLPSPPWPGGILYLVRVLVGGGSPTLAPLGPGMGGVSWGWPKVQKS